VPVPTVLGHEILGRIVAFGPEARRVDAWVRPLGEGDRVTWAIVANCGECFYCARDLPQKCEHGFKYGHEPIRPGRELSGGLASHCLLVPGTAIFRVPDEVPDEVACPSSCATATVAAAIEAAGPMDDGRSVLVLGAGMLGVTAAAWSRAMGASDVIACDRDTDRLAAAVAFGVTETCPPSQLAEVVMGATGGRGVDVALEMSGSPEAIEGALPLLRTGGTMVLIGSVFPTRPVPIVPERIVRGCLAVQGVHNYAPRHLRAALAFLAAYPEYPFGTLVDPWRGLDELDALVASAPPPGALRIGIRPGPSPS
jgi:alcohol dehydrogenase